MARTRTASRHYHGHVNPVWMPSAEPARDTFQIALDSPPHEVAAWLAAQLREAVDKPDMDLSDELSVWVKLAQDGETITTGLQSGPTITAIAMPSGQCWCDRPELHPVESKHGR